VGRAGGKSVLVPFDIGEGFGTRYVDGNNGPLTADFFQISDERYLLAECPPIVR
jgi:hypothetical protein